MTGEAVASGRPAILVVGDVMVDVVAAHATPLRPASDTPASITIAGGGSAANTACWLAAIGELPRLLAAVGDDDLGRWALADLARAGVDHVGPVLPRTATGACVVLVGPDGERTMLPDRAANDLLPVGAVSGSFGNGASTGAADAEAPTPGAPRGGPAWVHLSGYALIGSGSRAAGRAALRAALAHGCPVSIDAASSGPLADVGAAAFLDWCDGATVLLANDDEAAALGGVRAILTRVSTVVVKHGRAGATWTDGTDSVSVPGQVVEAADSTGAGDAFAAGWIRARLAGRDRREALLDAVAVATRAVAKAGARP